MAIRPLSEVKERFVRGARLQKIGNSRGVIIPSDWIDALDAADGDGRIILDLTLHDDMGAPAVRIQRGWEPEARDEAWAKEVGKRAFIELYSHLGIHPGMGPEAQIEAARLAHGESAPWEHLRSFYGGKGLKTEVRHTCIDPDAGETDADAELSGCMGEEFCGWHLAKGKIPNIVEETFRAEAALCWPDEDVRDQIMHPDWD